MVSNSLYPFSNFEFKVMRESNETQSNVLRKYLSRYILECEALHHLYNKEDQLDAGELLTRAYSFTYNR